MADAIIKLVDDTGNTASGCKGVDNSSLTIGANTVYRQRMNLADPVVAGAIANLGQFHTADGQVLGVFYGMAMGSIGLGVNAGNSLDRLRVTGGDGVSAVGLLAAHGYMAQLQTPVAATNSPTAGNNKVINIPSTTGMKLGGLVSISGGGNQEFARINGIAANTSITVDILANGYATPIVTPVLHSMLRDVSQVGDHGTLKVGAVTPGMPLTSSATGAAIVLDQTFAAAPGKLNWLTGFTITGVGSTAGGAIQVTTTGLTSNLNYTLPIPATVEAMPPFDIRFPHPIPASGVNTAIVLNVPSFGAGNTNSSVSMYGFQTVP